MEKNDLLDDRLQVNNSNPTDVFEPGDGNQLVDLTEFYKESEQDKATVVVSGLEELSLGVLSKKTASLMGLKGLSKYEPYASRFNARLGSEGFFSAIHEGFKKFIENVIKYIRMAINWIVNLIKGVFGFKKSSRITKEISGKLANLEEEFTNVMLGFGFPKNEFNVAEFLGELSPNENRMGQLTLLVSKFQKEGENIKGLNGALPLLTDCILELKKIGERFERPAKELKRTIAEEHKRLLVTRDRGVTSGVSKTSVENNRVYKGCLEVRASLDISSVYPKITALFEELYKIKFTNEELEKGFGEIRTKLDQNISVQVCDLTKTDIPETLAQIQYLNKRYQEIKDDQLDLSSINWKALGLIIEATDAERVQQIASHYSYQPLVGMYQTMSLQVRDFTNFCHSVSTELLKVVKQIDSLTNWHARTQLYYQALVLNDFETMLRVSNEAKASGLTPYVQADGFTPIKFEMLTEAQAQGFFENTAEVNYQMLSNDVGGVKTRVNKLSKQLGLGGI